MIVESDAQNIVQAIQAGQKEGACIGHIVDYIGEFLKSFAIGHIKYTPRGTNKVAHMFAQHAKEIVDRNTWRNIGPNFILNQLQEDVPARSAS